MARRELKPRMARATADLAAHVGVALAPIECVLVAYVFGSQVTGAARNDSDLDVAVAFRADLDERGREDARRTILAALTDALGNLGERSDIVHLETADSAVAFRAIREGRLVANRSDADRVRIVTRVGRRYDDDAPKRALFRRAARDAAARMAGK